MMSYVLLIERHHQKTQTPIIAREVHTRKRQITKDYSKTGIKQAKKSQTLSLA